VHVVKFCDDKLHVKHRKVNMNEPSMMMRMALAYILNARSIPCTKFFFACLITSLELSQILFQERTVRSDGVGVDHVYLFDLEGKRIDAEVESHSFCSSLD
jgi:hypothetical protein